MLSVNPARRADISAICSHCWINETYSETCLEVAEELARQTPVRLDLLLSLTTPLVTPENIVTSIQVFQCKFKTINIKTSSYVVVS